MSAMTTAMAENAAEVRSGGSRALESLGIGAGAVSFAVAAIAAVVAFRFRSAHISGESSLGEFTAIAGAPVVTRPGGRRISAPWE